MKAFSDMLLQMEEYKDLLLAFKNKSIPALLTGVSRAQKAQIAFSLLRHLNLSCAYVTSNDSEAEKAADDLRFFYDNVLVFKDREFIYYDVEAVGYDFKKKRIEVLNKLVSGEQYILVLSVDALLSLTLPKQIFMKNVLTFEVGCEVDFNSLAEKFVKMGYKHEDVVSGRGTFSIRGGILDFYSYTNNTPVRIEFFDNEVDSIREYDAESQLSVGNLNKTTATVVTETVIDKKATEKILKKLEGIDGEIINKDRERLLEQHMFPSVDKYTPYIYKTTVADYIENAFYIFDEPLKISERAKNLDFEKNENTQMLFERGNLPDNKMKYFEGLRNAIKKTQGFYAGLSSLVTKGGDFKFNCIYSIITKGLVAYGGKLDALIDDLVSFKNRNYSVIILGGSKNRANALKNTLSDMNIEARLLSDENDTVTPREIVIVCGSLSSGFEYPLINCVVIGDKEILPSHKKTKKKTKIKSASSISDITDLSYGDYVVHQNYGIGKYMGINQLVVEGITKDYLKIAYEGSDVLYVPTNQLDLINKFIGTEGRKVKLNRMDSVSWAKTKQRVKESCRELAENLVRLYAERSQLEGYAFSPDNGWQRQFENNFPYEETEDQIRCINETKADMERPHPMDRLLCGDVGYGKTEVAIRAAFKATLDGKQVAYLVPTTILARQHYVNFKERMADFPVNIEMLSRFRTKQMQNDTIRKLKTGEMDIVIGTHRLLSKDISFKDLGLLIIDEEQRFGVAHKEKLKELKKSVDVLTLTATPIPRTLHMAMSGIRDMSVIENPPEERYPITTYVMEYNKDVVYNAIQKELSRQGQVYYLFNRVQGITREAAELQKDFPDAKVAAIHGKMSENAIEDIMEKVLAKEIDILVCTTIIETGIDIPNVNTIIIEDSDRMGLSQLYQLRGRVGRSNRMAYAYLTFRKDKSLSEIAEKRLKAIKEFTEFGSGFKIAMRDLEIRGAGNLLGGEQHGHMDLVGYDLYCKLLKSAVKELGGDQEKEKTQTIVDIGVSAYIPETYIKRQETRIEVYKKIASIENENDSMDVLDELIDRFGELPSSVMALIEISVIKSMASCLNISEISQNGKTVILKFDKEYPIDMQKISSLINEYKGQILFNAGVLPYISYNLKATSQKMILSNIKSLLQIYEKV